MTMETCKLPYRIPFDLSHNLETILYRYGYSLLRDAREGEFELFLSYPSDNEIQENSRGRLKGYLSLEYRYNLIIPDFTETKRTENPQKLLALHLEALNGKIYQSPGIIVFLIPGHILSEK